MESTTCPACGEVLPARAIFCRTCGARLQFADEQAPAQLQQGLDPGDQEAPTQPQQDPGMPPEHASEAPAQPEIAALPKQGFDIPAQPAMRAGPAARPGVRAKPLAPARKKRKTGLFVLVPAILLIVIAGGVLGVVVLNQKHILASKPPTPTSTPRPTFTPTPNRTRGFLQFSNSKYSLLYPGGWAAVAPQSLSKDDEEFIASPQEMFQVQVIAQAAGQPTPKLVDDVTCQTFFGANNTPDAPTMVSITNQQWTRETCEGTPKGQAMQVLVESAVYQNQVFTLFYNAPPTTFASDQQHYFTPMEQSFTFLM